MTRSWQQAPWAQPGKKKKADVKESYKRVLFSKNRKAKKKLLLLRGGRNHKIHKCSESEVILSGKGIPQSKLRSKQVAKPAYEAG